MRRMVGLADQALRHAVDTVAPSPDITSRRRSKNDDYTQTLSPRTAAGPPGTGRKPYIVSPATSPAPGDGPMPNPASQRSYTSSQSVLNLINCILGAGVLGYPYCFKSCGLLLATLLLLVTLVAGRISYQLLLYCTQLSQRRSYGDIAEQALGAAGRQLVELCTAALNLGAIVAYLNILADVLSSVAGTLIPPGAEPSRNQYIAGVTLLGALPTALIVRDHSMISAFGTATVGFIFLFAFVIAILSLGPAAQALLAPAAAAAATTASGAAAAGKLLVWEVEGLLVAFPVMAYGFTAHPYYLGIYNMLPTPNTRRMTRVTDMAMGLSALVYWTVGVGGYVMFKQRTAGDLLRNFGGASAIGLRGAYERALKLCYGAAILAAVPLTILPFYSIVAPLLDANQLGPARGAKGRSSGTVSDGESGGLLKSSGGSSSKLPREAYVQQAQMDPHLTTPQADMHLNFAQHALVVFVVLGLGMASALWLPNVEFTFGLTGATASVLISYIIPAVCFLRLYNKAPELGGGSNGGKRALHVPADVRMRWAWRRRAALGLLLFGVVSCIMCTDAILMAVKEEKAVVQLAQELVQHEAVVAEATRAEHKAKEAAVAVSAVSTAAQSLGAVKGNTNATLGALEVAAAALSTIADGPKGRHRHPGSVGGVGGGGGGAHGANQHATGGRGDEGEERHHSLWDIGGRLQEHKAKMAQEGVLRGVEGALAAARTDITATMASVEGVVAKLDASIAQIKEQATRVDAGEGDEDEEGGSAAPAATIVTGAAGAAGAAGVPGAADVPGAAEVVQQQQALNQTHVQAHQASSTAPAPKAHAPHHHQQQQQTQQPGQQSQQESQQQGEQQRQQAQQAKQAVPSAGSRASEMARDFSKALGTFSAVGPPSNATAGRSLEGLRDSATSALAALNQTLGLLEQVEVALLAARADHKHGAAMRGAAADAMQRVVNATKASALAMKITYAALSTAANEETSELLTALNHMLADLEKAAPKGAGQPGKGGGGGVAGGSDAAVPGPVVSANGTAVAASGAVMPGVEQQEQQKQEQQQGRDASSLGQHEQHEQQQQQQQQSLNGQGTEHSAAGTPQPANQQVQGGAASPQPAASSLPVQSPQGGSSAQAAAAPGAASVDTQQSTAAGHAGVPDATAAHLGGQSPAVSPQPQGSSSSSVSPSGAAAAPASPATSPTPAASAAAAAAAHSELSAEQLARVRAIIANLTQLLSTSGSSSAASSNSSSSSALGADEDAVSLVAIQGAIEGALEWAKGSRGTVMSMIGHSLGASHPKVAKRVVNIITDMTVQEGSGAGQQQQQQQQQRQRQQQQQQQQQQHQQQHQQETERHEGPVVTVSVNGTLLQHEDDASGPVVAATRSDSPAAGAMMSAGTTSGSDSMGRRMAAGTGRAAVLG